MPILDIIQFAFMLICAPLAITIILVAVPFSQTARWAVGIILAAWFGLTATTEIPNIGPLPGGLLGIVLPIILVSLFMALSPVARRIIDEMNVPLLVALHVTRLAGVCFCCLPLKAACQTRLLFTRVGATF